MKNLAADTGNFFAEGNTGKKLGVVYRSFTCEFPQV